MTSGNDANNNAMIHKGKSQASNTCCDEYQSNENSYIKQMFYCAVAG